MMNREEAWGIARDVLMQERMRRYQKYLECDVRPGAGDGWLKDAKRMDSVLKEMDAAMSSVLASAAKEGRPGGCTKEKGGEVRQDHRAGTS